MIMNNLQKVEDYIEEKYSFAIGDVFDPNKHTGHKLKIGSEEFDVLAGVYLPGNKISFISFKYKADSYEKLYSTLNDLIQFLKIEGGPLKKEYADIATVFLYKLGEDNMSKIQLKLYMWNRVSSRISDYELELRLE